VDRRKDRIQREDRDRVGRQHAGGAGNECLAYISKGRIATPAQGATSRLPAAPDRHGASIFAEMNGSGAGRVFVGARTGKIKVDGALVIGWFAR
jgi:hypothetical protein